MSLDRVRTVALAGALLVALALVVALGIETRSLRAAYQDLGNRAREPHAGIFVPTFRAATLRGDSLTVGALPASGRQVVFVFTTTCPYCRASLPAWRQLARDVDTARTVRVQVVGVSWDSAEQTRRYAAEQGLTFPIVRFPERKLGVLYRARAVPVTLVLDSTGRVLFGHVGVLTDTLARDSVWLAIRFRAPAVKAGGKDSVARGP
jgi:peroxiredoxin